ncbi:hypothetical protein BJX68DRAFT_280194 [Aspergillus pseudodeflectus]|uniref:D-xylose 1-dehydrogenase (NADP(+), D-xylono-1,5-lactone-forming) n=1 Tax=Aspergillus pseudodeflectus TaxID=176178 RepID=A0ABR4JBH7_9EURO
MPPYGSYGDPVSDPNVENVLMILNAGKHVLCEEPITVTAEQARALVDLARQKALFLMEAVWTRFQPLTKEVCRLIVAGEIGNVTRAKKEKPVVVAAANRYHTGVDDDIALVLHFQKPGALGVATSSLRAATDVDSIGDVSAIRIQGSKGETRVACPTHQPCSFTLVKKGHVRTTEFSILRDEQRKNWGKDLFWEADEVARCIIAGKTESDILPLDEAVATIRIMEEALRQGGVMYPATITSLAEDTGKT